MYWNQTASKTAVDEVGGIVSEMDGDDFEVGSNRTGGAKKDQCNRDKKIKVGERIVLRTDDTATNRTLLPHGASMLAFLLRYCEYLTFVSRANH